MNTRSVEWIQMLYNAWQDALRDRNPDASYYRERWQEAVRNQ